MASSSTQTDNGTQTVNETQTLQLQEQSQHYDDRIEVTKYELGKTVHCKLEQFIQHLLKLGVTIFGGYVIFTIKKSHFTNLFYEYCKTHKIDFKSNFNNPDCHPESKFRMETPFKGKSDIDMFILEEDLDIIMNFLNKQYKVIEISSHCSYFIDESMRSNLNFKKLKLVPIMSETVSSSLNLLLGIDIKEYLFHHIFVDLIIKKKTAIKGLFLYPPFNCPDFKCNQFIMYWSHIENREIISQNNIPVNPKLSIIDKQISVHNTIETIKAQCINNIAELCDIIPNMHRVLKMLMKGYTIKIPLSNIPGGKGHFKHKIPDDEKTNETCAICRSNFEEDTTILYTCTQCSLPYHIDCYIMFHINHVKTNKTHPNCPKCRNIINVDYCAYVNMVYLIDNFTDFLTTQDSSTLSNIEFHYCNNCKRDARSHTLPAYINNKLFIIYY